MVESNATAATEMASRLHAKYRWCITGTPIQRKLDDLYGLLRFLKACPFDVSRWWVEVMREPYEVKPVSSLVEQINSLMFGEGVDNDFSQEIKTLSPARTFLEKAFLLAEEFMKDRPRTNRMSRHLYDIEKLSHVWAAREATWCAQYCCSFQWITPKLTPHADNTRLNWYDYQYDIVRFLTLCRHCYHILIWSRRSGNVHLLVHLSKQSPSPPEIHLT